MKRGEDLRILIPELTDYAFKAVALEDAVISSRAKTHAPVAYIYIYIYRASFCKVSGDGGAVRGRVEKLRRQPAASGDNLILTREGGGRRAKRISVNFVI